MQEPLSSAIVPQNRRRRTEVAERAQSRLFDHFPNGNRPAEVHAPFRSAPARLQRPFAGLRRRSRHRQLQGTHSEIAIAIQTLSPIIFPITVGNL